MPQASPCPLQYWRKEQSGPPQACLPSQETASGQGLSPSPPVPTMRLFKKEVRVSSRKEQPQTCAPFEWRKQMGPETPQSKQNLGWGWTHRSRKCCRPSYTCRPLRWKEVLIHLVQLTRRVGLTARTLKHICVQSLRTAQPVPLQYWCFVIPMSSLLAFSSTATSSGPLSNSPSENWPVCFCLVFPSRAEPREDRVLPSPPTSHTVWVWLRAHSSQVLCHWL